VEKKTSFYRSLFQVYPSFTNNSKKEALNAKDSIEAKKTASKKKEYVNELKEKLTAEYKSNLE